LKPLKKNKILNRKKTHNYKLKKKQRTPCDGNYPIKTKKLRGLKIHRLTLKIALQKRLMLSQHLKMKIASFFLSSFFFVGATFAECKRT